MSSMVARSRVEDASMVHRWSSTTRPRQKYPQPLAKKILREGLTRVGFIEYHNNLYGDAARGCHHRGNGPDARMRTIFVSRQRLGALIEEGPRRNPWGYRGGACRSDPVHVTSPEWIPPNQWNRSGPYLQEKEVNQHGCQEEGREEASCQEESLEEEVRHFSSIVS
jgi:hypothetical protein